MARKPRKLTPQYYKYAVDILRHGYVDPLTKRRMGKFADGFEAADGYDMRKIDKWTPAQKAKITRYFNEVNELAARPFQIYRPRNKKNLRAVQQFSQHEKYLKDLKVAFVPVADPSDKIKIEVKKRNGKKIAKVTERGVSRSAIPLDFKALQANAYKAVQQAVKNHPSQLYGVNAGKFTVFGVYDKEMIAREIAKLVMKYNAKDYDPRDKNSSYYKNWLNGITAYQMKQEKQVADYLNAKQKARKKLKDRRRNLRRKLKKQWGF